MFNKIFRTPIPSWVILAIVALVILSGTFFLNYFKKVPYDYNFFVGFLSEQKEQFNYGSWPALQNTDFFNQVRDKFVKEKVDFIESDLSKMVLRVYVGGEVKKEVKILSKGKEGSWWETPAGLYKIEGKEKSHFSSFGKVYMPWSMPFQGNFFIHGWPYYPDGTEVDSTYSGGCIRLSTEDAKEVFDLAQQGMPVLVYDDGFGNDNFVYQPKIPLVLAKNYLAADLKNNFVFMEKESNEIVPIASLTKLVTAVVATEYINLEKKLEVPKAASVFTSKSRLKAGQEVSVFDLLHLLLLESSNEAAITLASYLGPIRFVELMNKKAVALGMKNTKFIDPAGSGEGNISSAEDLFALSKYLYNNRSFILRISSEKINNLAYGESSFSDLENFNVFKDDPDFLGGKVGETKEARQTILSIFELKIGLEIRPVVIIALGSEDRAGDAANILNYVRSNY